MKIRLRLSIRMLAMVLGSSFIIVYLTTLLVTGNFERVPLSKP
jgi:hypothetical protein